MGINSYREFLDAFNNKILPLLQEYFYNDYEKIADVLNENVRDSQEVLKVNKIVHKKETTVNSSIKHKYFINPALFNREEFPSDAFIKVYQDE